MLSSGDAPNLVSDADASFVVDGPPRPGSTFNPDITSHFGTTSGNDAL